MPGAPVFVDQLSDAPVLEDEIVATRPRIRGSHSQRSARSAEVMPV